MVNLFEMLARAQGGAALDMFSRQFRLTPQQTEAAVEALLPAFIIGLQRMASTPEGLYKLGNLVAQSSYQSFFNNPAAGLFGQKGEQVGNTAVSTLFGSQEIARAVAAQAAQFAGIGTTVMERMLPLMTAMMLGGLSQAFRPGASADAPGSNIGTSESMDRGEAEPAAKKPPPSLIPAPDPDPVPNGPKNAASFAGQGLFDQMIDAGRNIQQAHMDNMRRIFEAFLARPDRDRRS